MKKSEGKSFVILSHFAKGEERVIEKMEFKKNSMKGEFSFDFSEEDFH